MKLPLLIKVYIKLNKGWKRLSPEAKLLVRKFVQSQERNGEYLNAGGKPDDYYTQFGKVLEAVFSPMKILSLPIKRLTVRESLTRDTVYGEFFRFILDDLYFHTPHQINATLSDSPTTNAVCCMLTMRYQMGKPTDQEWVKWLLERQDKSGGFLASDVAPVPDLLTTAVALFTLRLLGEKPRSAADFIDAHWMENGGFAPTILDQYSDVEYVFYGLLALGTA